MKAETTADVAAATRNVKLVVKQAPVTPPLLSTPSIVPPLTSLALYKDGDSGMQVSIVRNRLTGEVMEQIPTERVRRLAAMVRQQEMLAQELQQGNIDIPHIDLET